MRQLGAAGAAPGRPEVQHHRASLYRFLQGKRLPRRGIGNRKWRRSLGGVRRREALPRRVGDAGTANTEKKQPKRGGDQQKCKKSFRSFGHRPILSGGRGSLGIRPSARGFNGLLRDGFFKAAVAGEMKAVLLRQTLGFLCLIDRHFFAERE